MAFYAVTHKYSCGQYFDSIVFKNPTNKEIMEVFSNSETLRKIEGLYDYKHFKFIYTNNDHFYVWSSPIYHKTINEEVVLKEEEIRWVVESRAIFIPETEFEPGLDTERITFSPINRIVIKSRTRFFFAGNVMNDMKSATQNERNEILTKVEQKTRRRLSFLNVRTLFTIKKFRDMGKGG